MTYFIFVFELLEVEGVADVEHLGQIGRCIAQIELQLVLDGVPLRVLVIDLRVLLQIVFLQVEHSLLTVDNL